MPTIVGRLPVGVKIVTDLVRESIDDFGCVATGNGRFLRIRVDNGAYLRLERAQCQVAIGFS